MPRFTFALLALALLLSSCAAPAIATVTPLPPIATLTTAPAATATFTLTPTLAATATQASTATATRIPPTSTVDLASLPPRTPQPPAICPAVNPKAKFPVAALFKDKKAAYHDVRAATLEFLNGGGDPQVVIQKFAENEVAVLSLDVTNDGIQELFIPSGYLSLFGCNNGQYKTLLEFPPIQDTWSAVALVIQDLNRNGMPELVIAQPTDGPGGYDQFANYSIHEWDGKEFVRLISGSYSSSHNSINLKDGILRTSGHSRSSNSAINGNWQLEDVDGNGLEDFTVLAGVKDTGSLSHLEEKVTLKWDGTNYIVSSTAIEATPTPKPTHTPLPFSATCNYNNPDLKVETYPQDIEASIANFLNNGGIPEKLQELYGIVAIKDLNQDSIPEIVIKGRLNEFWHAYIFSCIKGKYQNLLTYKAQAANELQIQLADLNNNDLTDIFIYEISCFNNRCGYLWAGEWNGESFDGILQGEKGESTIELDEPQKAYITKNEQGKPYTITWEGGKTPQWHPDAIAFGPLRLETHIFTWNGQKFTETQLTYSAPEYRFQAVQDGDRAAIAESYEKALNFYQAAIVNDNLDWWSPERRKYLVKSIANPSQPKPAVNTAEREQLSAYAYFRQMVIYLLTDKSAEAEKAYQLFQKKYSANAGAPYTEMATAFWNEYQKANNVGNACKAAIGYAAQYPDLLKPLGSDYHGIQSLTYKPSDVCPFK